MKYDLSPFYAVMQERDRDAFMIAVFMCKGDAERWAKYQKFDSSEYTYAVVPVDAGMAWDNTEEKALNNV